MTTNKKCAQFFELQFQQVKKLLESIPDSTKEFKIPFVTPGGMKEDPFCRFFLYLKKNLPKLGWTIYSREPQWAQSNPDSTKSGFHQTYLTIRRS